MSYFAPDNTRLFEYARQLMARRNSLTGSPNLTLRGSSPWNLSLFDASGNRTYTTYSRNFATGAMESGLATDSNTGTGTTHHRSTAPASSAQSAWANLSRPQQAGLYSARSSGLDPSAASSLAPRPLASPLVKPNRAPTKPSNILWSASPARPLSTSNADYYRP